MKSAPFTPLSLALSIALTAVTWAAIAWATFALAQAPPLLGSASIGPSASLEPHPSVLDAGAALPSSEEREALAAGRAMLNSLMREAGVAADAEPAFDPARVVPRASILGIPVAPPTPAARTRFSVPLDDPAGDAARSIARRVSSFPNLRAQVPGAVWRQDESARFAIRAQAACLAQLQHSGVRAHLLGRVLTTPVPAPVVLDAPIGGVAFVSLHLDRDIEVSCELASRLKALARILRAHGVLAVGVNSSYREQPKVSFHSFGLALDLMAFRTRQRTLLVADHFEVTPDVHTCEAVPKTPEGKAVLALVCAIAESGLFSSVLTPNYNEGHRDHVHVDLRPDDPRRFVR